MRRLAELVAANGGRRPKVLRIHYASSGAPDIVFEQEAGDLASLEKQIGAVTASGEFQEWSAETSPLLAESPKREVYLVVE